MADSPSTDNFTLGKGIVYYNKKNITTGLLTGERDLGNAPEFSFNTSLEKLEHFSSRSKLKAKDKEIISQITPGVTFTLDELTSENLALLTLAEIEEVTQAAGSITAEPVTAHLGRRVDLSKRSIGVYTVTHENVTTVGDGVFVVGNAIASDNASPGVGIVAAVIDSNTIQIAVTSGVFADTDTITDVDADTAVMNADPIWVPGVIMVQDAADTITYVAGAEGTGNYQILEGAKDDQIGRILINSDQASPVAPIVDGAILHTTFGYAMVTYKLIKAFKEAQIEGLLRFVSDNPAGTQQELEIWRCSLTPSGDTAMIGDDWSTLGFVGEILKDEVGHPDSPYMNFLMN